jgi:hypothetical protein
MNRHTGVTANSQIATNRANTRTNHVTTARERGFRRAQLANNTSVNANTTARSERFARQQNIQRTRALNGATTRNVTVNRTRNVNRNVTLVNNWRGERFAGRNYVAFRNYHRTWHDRGWWDSHYGTSLTFVFGAPYFWSSGYWYPAWGYNPGFTRTMDQSTVLNT